MEKMISEELNQDTSHKSSRRLEITKFLFALGFLIFIILSFYPQYEYNPPQENRSSNYWDNYWQNLENFYSGNRVNPNQPYPIGETFSSISLIKHRLENGFTGWAFYTICFFMLVQRFNKIFTFNKKDIIFTSKNIGGRYVQVKFTRSISFRRG